MNPRALFSFSFVLFLGIFLFGLLAGASAQVYKWTDENGNVRFSDSPPAGMKAQKVLGLSAGSKAEAAPAPPGTTSKTENREKQKVRVVMYMTDWCKYCRKARELLQSLDVELVEYNVEKNREKHVEFKTKGGQGVPLIDVEGILIKGYNQDSIKSSVEEKRKR